MNHFDDTITHNENVALIDIIYNCVRNNNTNIIQIIDITELYKKF